MILAVSAVLILLLIGLGYLSAAQLSRMGSAGVTRSGNTDSAVDETVDLIGRMIANNTRAYTGSVTAADRAGYYATNPNPLYYPWLASTEPTDDDGASGGMNTGQTDGEWRVWKQITRLLEPSTTNTFLPYVTSNLASVGAGQTDINARRVGAPYWSDGTFVDADGDGVLDSKWTRLPIPGSDGMVWIAAVRIVDESGRVNANVATEAEWIRPGTNVLGASPADIDLKRLIAEADFRNGAADSGAPNWDDVDPVTYPLNASFVSPMLQPPLLLGYSTSNSDYGLMAEFYHAVYGGTGNGFVTTNTYLGLLPFTSNDRLSIWTSTGNNLDMISSNSPFRKLSTDTLADLRRRGGMPTAGWSTLESILDGKAIGSANPYPSGTAQTGVGPLLAAMSVPDSAFSGSAILTTNRLKASVRRDITTHSVSRPYRPRWLTNLAGPLTTADVKLNPNFPLPTPTTTNFTELDTVHTAMYQAFSAAETTNYYGGSTQDEARAYAAGMMANLMTYRTTNEYDPSLYFMADAAGKYYFGQQKQPFFTEAVAMILYADHNDADPVETLPGTFIDHPDPLAADTEWTGQYVMVELANPWESDLDLVNTNGGFYLVVNSDGTATQTPIPLWDTTNSVLSMTSNTRLLVHSRDTLHTTNDAALLATALAIQPDAGKRIEVDGLQWPVDAPQLTFELFYSTNGTTMIMVDRLSYSTTNLHPSPITWPPARIPTTTTNTDVGTDGWHHVISASIQRDDSEPAGTFPRYIYENGAYNLGVLTSNAVATGGDLTPANAMGDANYSSHDLNTTLGITLPPLQLFNKRADLETIGELANVLTIANVNSDVSLAFNNWEKTISEQLGSPTTIPYRDNGRLIFTAYVRAEPPRVPIAATLFDQFTLLPGSDLTRGTATPKVFGLINPNTATRRTLEVMPYIRGNKLIPAYLSPDITEPDLARGIIAYRDLYDLAVDPAVATGSDLTDTLNFVDREAIRDTANPMSLMATLRTEPGFASIGELLMVRREQSGIAPNNNDLQFGMNRQLFDGFDAAERDGDMSPLDTIEGDYEEEVLHFNRISNLVTLTSDVFVAHVVLQGRKRDPVTGDYETAVERRFIVGYDRSNVVGNPAINEKPRVLFFVEDR